MKRTVNKSPKIALCRKCRGTGFVRRTLSAALGQSGEPVGPRLHDNWHHTDDDGVTLVERCPQCEGSGRVTVSAVMEFDIRPYKRKEQ